MDSDRFLELTDARLRYRDEGSGPAIVLIHGWALDLDMWEPQVSDLSRTFRLIRFDRRGYGLSSGKPSVPDDAADVQALCRHLGVRRAALVGMSQGARVLHHLAGAIPASICCLIFDGAPDMRPSGSVTAGDVPLSEYAAILRNEGIAALRHRWAAHPLTRLRTEDQAAHALLSRMLWRYAATDLKLPVGELAQTPRRRCNGGHVGREPATAAQSATSTAPRLEDIHVPALVLNGEFDLESRKLAGEALSRLLPRAQRKVISGAGHLANLDNPQIYNGLLRKFVERYARADDAA